MFCARLSDSVVYLFPPTSNILTFYLEHDLEIRGKTYLGIVSRFCSSKSKREKSECSLLERVSFEGMIRGRFVSGAPTRFFVTRTESIVHLCSLVVSRAAQRFYPAKQRHFGRAREQDNRARASPPTPALSLPLSLALFSTQQVDRCFRHGT